MKADRYSNTILKNGIAAGSDKLYELYQNAFHNSQVAAYICGADGTLVSYNEQAAALWGRRPEVGKEKWDGANRFFDATGVLLQPDQCPIAQTLRTGKQVRETELIIERTDGKKIHVLTNPTPLYNREGVLIGAVNILFDMSEIKAARRQAEESDERFKILAEQAPLMIWMTDSTGKFIYTNPAWEKITGVSRVEDSFEKWQTFIHPDDRERVHHAVAEALKQKSAYHLTYRFLDHQQEFIIVRSVGTPMYNARHEFAGFIVMTEDVTLQENTTAFLENQVMKRTNDLMRKNEELRRSEERYHKMIDEVQDYAIILLDKDGFIQNWNKGAQHIKGYSAEEAIGMNFRMFYTKEDQASKLPEQLIHQAVVAGKANHEGWRVRKDGTKFWGSIVITSLHDADNNVIGFSKVTRDLTERKKAEEVYLRSAEEIKYKNKELEKMNQELASFAYVSSHDLQEPLRKIQTFASRIVETETNLSEKGKDYFGRMQNAAFRMQTLIEDLLAYSRTNTAEKKFETTNLGKLLDDVKGDLKERIEEKHARIDATALPTMDIIVFQFRQLLTNILSNALKFSKHGVAPHITISHEIVKGSALGSKPVDPSASYHHFSIADNGIGFEPEHKQKIFEVFQRLHGRSEYSGTGIGLAICKKIVENHGGIIYAESELGEGATFHIIIPEQHQQHA